VLAGQKDVSAVHLISHGSDGEVHLGSSLLNFDSLLKNAAQIKGWGQSLASGADLMIYGCNVAQNDDGKALVDALSRLTGADVAASEDATGALSHGYNWDLEYQAGLIETQGAISYSAQLDWQHILNTYTVTTTADSGAGSLRTAITSANGNWGSTINFSIAGGGVKTITLASNLPNINAAEFMDGWSQGGAGYHGTPLIEINLNGWSGLNLSAGGATLRGFIVNRANNAAVQLGGTGNLVVGNWIGLNNTGTAASANAGDGVQCFAPDGTLIGKIKLPEGCANVCFGMLRNDRLFMTATTSVYAIYLLVRGHRTF